MSRSRRKRQQARYSALTWAQMKERNGYRLTAEEKRLLGYGVRQ